MTRNDSGKYKRIRNNSKVRVAPCTMRGQITGPEFEGTARVLPAELWKDARKAMQRRYWLMLLPFWSAKNEFLEIEVSG
jgi:PPOX class probable F420-dependent enzyme